MSFFIVHQITPQLFISDVYAAKSHKTLAKYGITHILSLLSFSNIRPLPTGVENLCLDILDYPDENIIDEFGKTNEYIGNAIEKGGKVLIHCQAGISRSTTCLCAYLMQSLKIPREEALKMVKDVRSHVRPNEGFWEQLQVFEDCRYEPRRGIKAYDDWLVRFYRLGGPADPAKVEEVKLLEKAKI